MRIKDIQKLQSGGFTEDRVDFLIKKHSGGKSPLTAKDYLEVSAQTGVPIQLLLAQGLQESHFGTRGTAVRTKNVGNVGNTGKKESSNNTWRDGLLRQAKLLSTEYGVKSEADINRLISNNFARPKGGRYAEDNNYGNTIAKSLNTIGAGSYKVSDIKAPLYNYDLPNQPNQHNVDFINHSTNLQTALIEQQKQTHQLTNEMYSLLNAEYEFNNQKEIEKQEEQELLAVQNKLKEKQLERENFLAMIPQAGDVSDNNIQTKIMQKGGTIKEIYEQKTGKAWSTAKTEGFTDGSYEGNMKLRKILLSEDSNKIQSPLTVDMHNNADYSTMKSFNDAFKKARTDLGANNVFLYKGQKYGTNLDSEIFKPNKDTIDKYGLNVENIEEQNKQVASPFTTKEVVKVEKEWKDWEGARSRQAELNKMEDADKIINFHKDKDPDSKYIIVDKKQSRVHVYKGGEKLDSYETVLGANKGDAQTVTKQIDGKTDWTKGNWSTGAGVFEISNKSDKNKTYYDLPSYNLKNSQGIEISTAFHGTPMERRKLVNDGDIENNRASNGCINGTCSMLTDFRDKHKFDIGSKVYILPEDEGNRFEIVDGKPVLRVKDRGSYEKYIDSNGEEQKGQGINIDRNTLNYKPIKYQFSSDIPENAKVMAQELTTRKKEIMKSLKIDSDVYNDLSLLALGIAGQESKYGSGIRYQTKKHLPIAVKLGKMATSDFSEQSSGMTQVKFDSLNSETRNVLASFGIDDKEKLWSDPNKAILTTMIVLGKMYNDELKDTKLLRESGLDYTDALMYLYQGKKKELINKTATPEKNKYINSVKKLSKQFKLKQYM